MPLMGVEVLGGYPRSPLLRKTLRRLEEKGKEGKITALRVIHEATITVIGVQLGARMTTIVDGLLDWHDLLRPFAEAWRGVYLDGLLRWFDNNFFYRIPVFVEPPDPKYYVFPPRIHSYRDLVPEGYGLKAVLPGPYTFTKLSKNKTGQPDEALMEQIAEIIGREARLSAEAGATAIQVEEPFMGDIDADPGEVETAIDIINEKIVKSLPVETRIAIQYNPPSQDVYRKLLEAKTDYIVIDFADAPRRALELLSNIGCGGKGLGVGAIQARDLREEDYTEVKKLLLEAEKCAGKIILTTSAWLDQLPYRSAIDKTRILGQIASQYLRETQ